MRPRPLVTQIAFFIALASLLVALSPRLGAAENPIRLVEEEWRGLSNQVQFKSFQAAQMARNPEELVVGVGENLARTMLARGAAGSPEDYQFIRIAPAGAQLGADLLVLGAKSQINHVVNLQRILWGYLGAVYGFDRRRSQAVAQFLLTYNAVKRQDGTYLAARFAPAVAAQVPVDRMGIALEYTEWPGKTILLIPTLRGVGLSASEVGRVAAERMPDNAAGTNARKALLDLRREQVAMIEATNASNMIAIRKADNNQETREAGALQRASVARTPDEANRAREEQKRNEEIRRDMDATNRTVHRDVIAAAEERAAIAKEDRKLEPPTPAPAGAPGITETNTAGGGNVAILPKSGTPTEGTTGTNSQGEIFFLKTLGVTNNRQVQELLLINPKYDTAQVIPLAGVTGNHMAFIGVDPVVVLGDGKKNVLARIDRVGLTNTALSSENVFPATRIWLEDGKVYAVGESQGQTALLQFDTDLKLLARSDVVVYPDTQLAFAENKVYATVLQGNQNSHVLVLRKDNLNRVMVIR